MLIPTQQPQPLLKEMLLQLQLYTPPVGAAEAIPAAIEAADVPEAATATDCCEWSSLTSVQKSEAPLHLKLQVC